MFEATERLQRERIAGVTCAQVIKRHLPDGDKVAYSRAQVSYDAARLELMGGIAALETALIEGQEEVALAGLKQRLERGSELREAFCEEAIATLPTVSGERSLMQAFVTLTGSLVEAGVAIWEKTADLDQLRRDNLRTALEDAKWPSFDDA